MKYADRSWNLRIKLDTKNCELPADAIRKMEDCLDPLARLVKDFPLSDLYITVIHHPRSRDFHVKTSLVLPGQTLFTGDRDVLSYPAYERCIRKLVQKVDAYKLRMGNSPEIAKRQKGTRTQLLPTRHPEAEAIEQAVEAGDYIAFRQALDVYEEPVRKRVGRWIQRYPRFEAEIGASLTIADVVEEVFLNAFERFAERPGAVPLGEWLDGLVDPSIVSLTKNPDEELENVNFARTMRESSAGLPSRHSQK